MLCVVEQPDSMAKAALAASRERPLMIFLFFLFGGVRVIGSASDTLSEQSRGNCAIGIIAARFAIFPAGLEAGLNDFCRSASTKSPWAVLDLFSLSFNTNISFCFQFNIKCASLNRFWRPA
jgi:hypothetical protein